MCTQIKHFLHSGATRTSRNGLSQQAPAKWALGLASELAQAAERERSEVVAALDRAHGNIELMPSVTANQFDIDRRTMFFFGDCNGLSLGQRLMRLFNGLRLVV